MRWCAEGELAELWLRRPGVSALRLARSSARYADFARSVVAVADRRRSARSILQSLEDDDRAALRDGFRRRLGVGDGPFELTARAWAVAGRVPG
jgi:hypothetical protein